MTQIPRARKRAIIRAIIRAIKRAIILATYQWWHPIVVSAIHTAYDRRVIDSKQLRIILTALDRTKPQNRIEQAIRRALI